MMSPFPGDLVRLKKPSMSFLTPNFQNSLGIVISVSVDQKRIEVLWSTGMRRMVIESGMVLWPCLEVVT